MQAVLPPEKPKKNYLGTCSKCKHSDTVSVDVKSEFAEGLNAVKQSHFMKSPSCRFDYGEIVVEEAS
jgi:hypothetical protein